MAFFAGTVGHASRAIQAATGELRTTTDIVGTTIQVTGLGFAPKVVLFFTSGYVGVGTGFGSGGGSSNRMFGVALSPTDRVVVANMEQYNVSITATSAAERTDAVVVTMTQDGTDAIDGLADIQSFDADGFTLVVDDQFSTSERVRYYALGGDALQHASLVSFTEPAATGTQSLAFGYKPDAIILFGADTTSANTTQPEAALVMGLATADAQAVLACKADDARGDTVNGNYLRRGQVLAGFEASGDVGTGGTLIDLHAEIDAFTATGVTLDWTATANRGRRYFALGLKGGNWLVGGQSLPADWAETGTTTFTGLGGVPQTGLILGGNLAESTLNTDTTGDTWSLGAFVGNGSGGVSAQGAMSTLSGDDQGTADTQVCASENDVYLYTRGFADGAHRVYISALQAGTMELTYRDGYSAFNSTPPLLLYLLHRS